MGIKRRKRSLDMNAPGCECNTVCKRSTKRSCITQCNAPCYQLSKKKAVIQRKNWGYPRNVIPVVPLQRYNRFAFPYYPSKRAEIQRNNWGYSRIGDSLMVTPQQVYSIAASPFSSKRAEIQRNN